MAEPEGRYWVTVVGYVPASNDRAFLEHRANFVDVLVEFNELKEARELRKHLLATLNPEGAVMGQTIRTDLKPEYKAVDTCFITLHKKLNLK